MEREIYLGVLLGNNYHAYSRFWRHYPSKLIISALYGIHRDNELYPSGVQHKPRGHDHPKNPFTLSIKERPLKNLQPHSIKLIILKLDQIAYHELHQIINLDPS